MKRDSLYVRVGKKYFRTILLIVAGFFSLLLVWIGWIVATAFPAERTTIISSVDPLEIHSWDEKRKILTVIPIPGDVRIEGASGVGMLPVSSLVKLEVMDKTKKGILAGSLTHALGTPIREAGLSPPLRLRFFLATRTIRPDSVKRIDLDALGVYRAETLADETAVRVFDINRFDVSAGASFEVDSIRREELRVRVVNTTDVLGLGSRAARILSHAGMIVIAVDSEPSVQNECTIHAKQDLWSRQSVRFVKDVFDCVVTAQDSDERADVTVRLGSVYAQRFTSD